MRVLESTDGYYQSIGSSAMSYLRVSIPFSDKTLCCVWFELELSENVCIQAKQGSETLMTWATDHRGIDTWKYCQSVMLFVEGYSDLELSIRSLDDSYINVQSGKLRVVPFSDENFDTQSSLWEADQLLNNISTPLREWMKVHGFDAIRHQLAAQVAEVMPASVTTAVKTQVADLIGTHLSDWVETVYEARKAKWHEELRAEFDPWIKEQINTAIDAEIERRGLLQGGRPPGERLRGIRL